MILHRLKLQRAYFDDVLSGRKPFEIRIDDRNPRFEEGDVVLFEEWDQHLPDGYTGASFFAGIGYVLRDATASFLMPGYCAFALVRPTIAQTDYGAGEVRRALAEATL